MEQHSMTVIFVALMATTVIVSLVMGRLAKLPGRELVFQTAAMSAAALTFFGLVALL